MSFLFLASVLFQQFLLSQYFPSRGDTCPTRYFILSFPFDFRSVSPWCFSFSRVVIPKQIRFIAALPFLSLIPLFFPLFHSAAVSFLCSMSYSSLSSHTSESYKCSPAAIQDSPPSFVIACLFFSLFLVSPECVSSFLSFSLGRRFRRSASATRVRPVRTSPPPSPTLSSFPSPECILRLGTEPPLLLTSLFLTWQVCPSCLLVLFHLPNRTPPPHPDGLLEEALILALFLEMPPVR